MPRIRSLKPTFWSDQRVADLSRDARLLTIGLISFADDEGRFLASVAAIAGFVYPLDDIPPGKIRRWLEEVAEVGIIRLYQVGRHQYGMFPNYDRHQAINRPSASTFPSPNGRHPPDVLTEDSLMAH